MLDCLDNVHDGGDEEKEGENDGRCDVGTEVPGIVRVIVS